MNINNELLVILFVKNTGLTISILLLLPIIIGFIVAQYKKRNEGNMQQELNTRTLIWGLLKEVLWLGAFAFAYMIAIFGSIAYSGVPSGHPREEIIDTIILIFYISVYSNYVWGAYQCTLRKQLPSYRKFVILGIFAQLLILAVIVWS